MDDRQAKREDVTRVVRRARENVHGVPESMSGHRFAGDTLGRLALVGTAGDGVSLAQLAAGRLYEEIEASYQVVILARKMRSGSSLDHVGGYDSDDGTDPAYVASYERAKGRMVRARRALLLCGDPLAQAVVDAVVLEGKDMPAHVGVLRVALNAIGHEFRDELEQGARAA